MKQLYLTSIQYEQNGWYLHYAWGYFAESFDAALIQAMNHFLTAVPNGRFVSANMTDGTHVLFMLKNESEGTFIRNIVPVNTPTDDLIGVPND